MHRHLADQLGAAYPQAELRPVDGPLDPALLGFAERVAACAMELRAAPYLPIRTLRDSDVDDERAAQADPVLGILRALGDLPRGCEGSLPACAAPSARRLGLRLPWPWPGRPPVPRSAAACPRAPLAGVAALAAAVQGYLWYGEGEWLRVGALAAGVLLGLPALLWLWHRLGHEQVHDPKLVAEKVSRPAYTAQLRLAVFAPADVPEESVAARLARATAAYRQYSLPSGNGLVPVHLRSESRDLRCLDPLQRRRSCPVLNTRELAGLWHLPQAEADVSMLERTTARRLLPRPDTVARGCPIGTSEHQGARVPVSLSDDVLGRNILLVAKTRRGKSSLMVRLARYLMERPDADGEYRCLVLVDPHSDLAREALALVPPGQRGRVVYLDVANPERPFGLNLIDTALWPDRDKAVSSTLTIFNREFDRSWGSRMEDAFRFALLTLYEANRALCAGDPNGRRAQHTVLDVPSLYRSAPFRRSVLRSVADPGIADWWRDYDGMDRRLQEEVTKPVKTKIHRFMGSRAGRALVGQPASTVDPAAWLRDGSVVILNTARGAVGEGTSSLVGSTLINLVAMVAAEQTGSEAAERRRVTFLVDEFHTMPGADYEYILSELAKYGANIVLATQSLASLEAVDRENNRRLRARVFANLDGLFAFHTSAEDARYLVPELDGRVDEADLAELGNHSCYARLTVAEERLPVFSVQLLPPPVGDAGVRAELEAESARRWGRDRRLVEADLRSALARVELSETLASDKTGRDQKRSSAGQASLQIGSTTDDEKRDKSRPRSKNQPRDGGQETADAQQLPLDAASWPLDAGDGEGGTDQDGEEL